MSFLTIVGGITLFALLLLVLDKAFFGLLPWPGGTVFGRRPRIKKKHFIETDKPSVTLQKGEVDSLRVGQTSTKITFEDFSQRHCEFSINITHRPGDTGEASHQIDGGKYLLESGDNMKIFPTKNINPLPSYEIHAKREGNKVIFTLLEKI